jgi:hypothetical protein
MDRGSMRLRELPSATVALNRAIVDRNDDALDERFSVLKYRLPPLADAAKPTAKEIGAASELIEAACRELKPASALLILGDGVYLLAKPGAARSPRAVETAHGDHAPHVLEWRELDDRTAARLALNTYARGRLDAARNNPGALYIVIGENVDEDEIVTLEVGISPEMNLFAKVRTFTLRETLLADAELIGSASRRDLVLSKINSSRGFTRSDLSPAMVRSRRGEAEYVLRKRESSNGRNTYEFMHFPTRNKKAKGEPAESPEEASRRRAAEAAKTKLAVISNVLAHIESAFGDALRIRFATVEPRRFAVPDPETYKAEIDGAEYRAIAVCAPPADADWAESFRCETEIERMRAESPKSPTTSSLLAKLKAPPEIRRAAAAKRLAARLLSPNPLGLDEKGKKPRGTTARSLGQSPLRANAPRLASSADGAWKIAVVPDWAAKGDGYGLVGGATQHISMSLALSLGDWRQDGNFDGASMLRAILKELRIKQDVVDGKVTAFDWTRLGLDELRCASSVRIKRNRKRDDLEPRGLAIDSEGRMEYLGLDDVDDELLCLMEGASGEITAARTAYKLVRGEETSLFAIDAPGLFTLPPDLKDTVGKLIDCEVTRKAADGDGALAGMVGFSLFDFDGAPHYLVGGNTGSLRQSVPHATVVRRVDGLAGFDPLPDILAMIDTGLVRLGSPPVLPFPIKYLREYASMELKERLIADPCAGDEQDDAS